MGEPYYRRATEEQAAIIGPLMAQAEKNIVGILLAAGTGSRFGGDKLLHPLPDGIAIAAHAARTLIAAGLLGSELVALDGDQGARAVLDRHRDALRLIDCEDPGVLYDIDRKSDVKP